MPPGGVASGHRAGVTRLHIVCVVCVVCVVCIVLSRCLVNGHLSNRQKKILVLMKNILVLMKKFVHCNCSASQQHKQETIMNVIIITVNWSSMASIKKAERAKLKAENAGYTLVSTTSTIMSSKLKYVKQ